MNKINTDQDVVVAIAENDHGFVAYFYQKFYDAIFGFIINNNGDESDAKRIFHEGVIILVQNIKKGFFSEEKSIRTLLYSICRRQWIKELENRSPFVVNISDKIGYMEFDEETSSRLDEEESRFNAIDKALSQLSEPGSSLLKALFVQNKELGTTTYEFGYSNNETTVQNRDKYFIRLSKFFKVNMNQIT